MRNLESIKKDFKQRIEELNALIEAWEKVERVRTKDGKDFKTLSKNFKEAKIENKEYSIKSYDKQIKVWNTTKQNRYITDSLDVVQLVEMVKFEVEEERIIKESFVKPYFILNVDEVFELINIRIANYKKQVASYKKQLEEIENNYNKVIGKLEEIHVILKNISDKGPDNDFLSTRYALEDVIKHYYFN